MTGLKRVHKIIMRKLELWIPGILCILGISFLKVFQNWLNTQVPKILEPVQILVTLESLILLLVLLGAYILLFRSKSKKDMTDLKAFLNKRVYSCNTIHSQFNATHPFRNIDEHLSWKPFYEALEKKAEEQKASKSS